MCTLILASCGNDSTTNDHSAKTTEVAPITTSAVSSAPIRDVPSLREVVPYYATDVKDLRRLAGLANAVFVGSVSEQSGVIIRYQQANTQFKVKVLQALKGAPAGDVIVEQEGGHDDKKNITYIVKGDAPLVIGSTYLFAATYRDNEHLYSIIPVYGDTLLTAEQASELQAGKAPQPVEDMRDAVAHQIPS
ncbi:hypothetical protein CCUG62472_02669 [Mycobacteroides salmoniphilum]|nr:hypothetical protein CCUG62472_02669 [Mycobacteroides salmoniphilum]